MIFFSYTFIQAQDISQLKQEQSQSPQEIKSTDTSSIPPNTISYFYNSNTNQLNHITGQVTNNYVYDARGSVTQDSSKAMTIFYDYRNMPAGIYHRKTLLGHTVADVLYFYYNAQGQRVKKRFDLKYVCDCKDALVPDAMAAKARVKTQSKSSKENSTMLAKAGPPSSQCISTKTTYTYYVYSGSQIIAEYDGSGSLAAYYVYGNGQRIAKVDSLGAKSYYHNDYLDSTRIVTNQGASKIFERDYYPFGTELFASGSGTDYKYNGKEFDDEAGINLYYYGARYYDPKLGRFLSVDPINNYTNPYSYVHNNPINASDPTGMWPKYIPRYAKGGLFGGFGRGEPEGFWDSRNRVIAKSQEGVGGTWTEIVAYYKEVEYLGESYTIWLDKTDKGFTIDPDQRGVKNLATAMMGTGDYNPEFIWVYDENGNLVEKEITKCNIFTHDLCELLGASYPHYGGEGSNKLVANDLYNWAISSGNAVSKDQAYAGFLVVWNSGSNEKSGHVGMYMGGDNFISRGKKEENYGSIEKTTAIMGSDPIYIPVYYVPDYYYQGGNIYEYWG